MKELKVWWMPQVPMGTRFEVEVKDEFQANLLLNVLADYDLFQLKHNIKSDFGNMGGVMMWEDGEWVDWMNDKGEEFDEYRLRLLC